MLTFPRDIAADLEQALSREWLETNGLGSFASSTVAGANTRRYHGLLVAATRPPLGRLVLLSKLEETLIARAGTQELGCNLYRNTVHPNGYRFLEEFRLDPWPVWRWNALDLAIEKSVCLLQQKNTVIVEYRLLTPTDAPVTLELRPLVAFRDYHSTTHENPSLNRTVTRQDGVISIQPYSSLPPLLFYVRSAKLNASGDWYFHFNYPRERERGLDFEEDLFQPFTLTARLSAGQPVQIVISLDELDQPNATELLAAERALRLAALPPSELPESTPPASDPNAPPLRPTLERAAEQFFAARGGKTTIIAGYHWFTDWGRDTMISLPGLALSLHRPDRAREVFEAFLPWMRQGLLPNRFPDAGEQPEYNSTDATLWFVEALRAYAQATADYAFIREHCYAALQDIVSWREQGTLYGIYLEDDGLLSGGVPGVQLTWMDARVDGIVITPRDGKPVEIQALWFNALRIMQDFAARFGDLAFETRCRAHADRAQASFAEKFWNPATQCLYDCIDGDALDASIRPNQLIAYSLPYPIGDPTRGAQVLAAVKRDLLTPFGLRTLAPQDPHYRPVYEGGQASRDGAYHQGTVWPWLLGPYARAHFAVHGRTAATLQELRALLDAFRPHLTQAGVGQVSEIFDGDPPHTPRGCIAQAWSVAELLWLTQALEHPALEHQALEP